MRRAYYDHECAWQRIRSVGGRGWDDRAPGACEGSYEALKVFLDSPLCPRPGPHVRAIDLGCGGGQASIMLAQRGFTVTGIDFSPTAVELACENAAQAGVAIDFVIGDCLDLRAFADAAFDLAIDNHVLHCIIGDDRACFLREVSRVLRRGGTLFCETMSAEGNPDFAALGVDEHARIDRHHTRYWTLREELLAELGGAGFAVAQLRARRQPEVPYPGDTFAAVATRTC